MLFRSYRCHAPTAMKRTNPHLPPEQGGSTDGCAACHSGTPAKGASPKDSKLRVAAADACATCHPGVVHAGASEHVGAILGTPLAEADASRMPVGEGGVIECWTCHDVHQTAAASERAPRGVAARIEAARNAEAAKVVPAEPVSAPTNTTAVARPSLLALPVDDGSLCVACHGKGP